MKCPICESEKNIPVLYSRLSQTSWAKVIRGEAVLGSSLEHAEDPTHACLSCGHHFVDSDSEEYKERKEFIERQKKGFREAYGFPQSVLKSLDSLPPLSFLSEVVSRPGPVGVLPNEPSNTEGENPQKPRDSEPCVPMSKRLPGRRMGQMLGAVRRVSEEPVEPKK